MTMHKILRAILVLSAAGGSLAAQIPSRGPLAGAALAFQVNGGITGGQDATTLVHRNGFAAAPPARFPGPAVFPGAPDLQAICAANGAAGLDLDDFSTGRDDVMVDSNGVLAVPPMGWGVFTFSFRNGVVGAPASRLHTLLQAAGPGTGGSTVFSWVLPGSLVPVGVADSLEQSHSTAELGLLASSALQPEVDALDLPVTMGFDQQNLQGLEPGFTNLLPVPQAMYFTVSHASRGLVPASWWLVGGQPTLSSGATILRVQKSSPMSSWTPPHVWKTYAELGLARDEDIDALAYDEANEKLLFSTVGNQRDQLLFLDLGTDGGPVAPIPVKKVDNTPVSDAIGSAGNDDIDAVCTLDPNIRSGLYVPDDFGASVGTPRDPYQPQTYPVGMNASAYRRFENGQSHYDTWMVGYPPATGVGPGYAWLLITLGDTLAPVIGASFQVRAPMSSIPGDPREYSLGVPPSFALIGMSLTFRWWASDAGLVQLAQALPVKVFL
jgi:hypothetical protein